MKRLARGSVGLAFAVVFCWLLFRQVSISDLRSTAGEASIPLLLAAVGAFLLGYACRIQRWRILLNIENPGLAWSGCAGPLMASVAANNVLPLRAGDIMRAVGFNRRLRVSVATSLTSLFIERLLDMLMVVSCLGLALAYFHTDASRLIGIAGSLLSAGAVLIVLLLLFPSAFLPALTRLARLVGKLAGGAGEKLLEALQKVFSALELTSAGRTMLKLMLWSALAWIAEGFVFWLVALSLPTLSNPLAAWLALSTGTLATLIPGTPGYVGSFDYFTAKAMTVLGNSPASAIAYALLVHVVLWLPASVVGGLYLLLRPVGKPDTSEVRS